ncbi:MAG: hypothetical protein FGM37_10610 [Phycisphaerales bacterium]|nr:hypothetical protein [Phycisphaerales bacterium]
MRQHIEQLDQGARVAAAESLMRAFVVRTGADGRAPSRRYLWTDAYAVLALVGLHRVTCRQSHLDSALILVRRVHEELGRFRADDTRSGWISGLPEEEGARRPTAGGLRIGKPELERPPGAALDERLEWDRDGQYFHYLTKWMIALNRLAHATGDAQWNDWAVDLAMASWPAFAAPPDMAGTPRMHWKMSTDLSRPLVASMGHHDPLDGLTAFAQIRASQRALGSERRSSALDAAWADMYAMCRRSRSWATTDPLGIGGILLDLAAIVRLTADGDCECGPTLHAVIADSVRSLDAFAAGHDPGGAAGRRLAFRELGLCIGLHAVDPIRSWILHAPRRFGPEGHAGMLLGGVQALAERIGLRDEIVSCWLEPAAQSTPAWRGHEDINSAMLAASLVPDACLTPCAPTVQEPS